MKKRFLFISCDEAKQVCDKAQYNEASGWERVQLRLRLLWCSLTRDYSKQTKQLSSTIDKAEISCLSSEERKNIELNFKPELKNHNQD